MQRIELGQSYGNFKTETPFDFSKNSSIGCGGFAPCVAYPCDDGELFALLSRLDADGIPFVVVGNMTNVLPPDDGLQKLVVCTKRMRGISRTANGLFVQAGVSAGRLLRVCQTERLLGAEFLAGVPCTLGGALFMNAGAGGAYVNEIVESVLVYRHGRSVEVSFAECRYGYKTSVFMHNSDVILGGRLRLKRASDREIAERKAYYLGRRAHLPTGKSMGCVFKNPDNGVSAGAWIEKSGLKGVRIGGAVISTEHANFIINDRCATSADVRKLIDYVKNTVKSRFGVDLQEEIRYLE